MKIFVLIRNWRLILFVTMLCLLALIPGANLSADDVNEVFIQTDWTGGASSLAATHPADKTGWNQYSTKDIYIDTSLAGKVMQAPEALSSTDTTDTQFLLGVRNNISIVGTGTAAALALPGVIDDPFIDNLGRWTTLPEAPAQSWWSPYVKAGNYIYSIWRYQVFARFDVTTETWEFLEGLPRPAGAGAALAYPGSGDYIYATRGGGTKNFYRYAISSNTWTTLADLPYNVSYGGSIASTGSDKIYCVAGGATQKFYMYTIATNTWVAKTNTISWAVTRGGSLVYPGSGAFLYLGYGQTGNFSRYLMDTDTWFTPTAAPVAISNLSYPGSGDYLYGWYEDVYDGRFARFSLSAQTWENLTATAQLPLYAYRGFMYYPGSGTKMKWLTIGNYAKAFAFDPEAKKWDEATTVTSFYVSSGQGNAVYDGTDYIYYTYGNGSASFARYSIANNRWAARTGMPWGVYTGNSMVLLGGIIYAQQGWNNTGFAKYDPLANSWASLAVMPATVYGGGSLATDGTYIYGLRGNGTVTFWRYDITANVWDDAVVADAPATVNDGGAMVYPYTPGGGDAIFVARGTTTNTFWKYTISTNTWTATAIPPYYFSGKATLTWPGSGDYIYAFFGHDYCFARYNFVTDSWETLPPAIRVEDSYYQAAAVNDKVYMARAYDHAVYTISTGAWAERDVPNTSSLVFGSIVRPAGSDTVYMVYGDLTSSFWKYSISQKRWIGLVKAPFMLGLGTKAAYPGSGNYFYVIEGRGSPRFWRYDFVNDVWSEMQSSLYPFATGSQIDAQGDVIYAMQGVDQSNTSSQASSRFLQYTISTNTWASKANLPVTIGNSDERGNTLVYIPSQGRVYWKRGWAGTNFYAYNIAGDIWSSLASTAVAAYNGQALYYPGAGDFLYWHTYPNGYFAKYSLTANAWTPLKVSGRMFGYTGNDGDMFLEGDFLYLHDGSINYFARYSFANDAWDTVTTFPSNVCMQYYGVFGAGADGNTLYAGGSTGFWAYSISARTWTAKRSPSNDIGWSWDEWLPSLINPDSGDYLFTTRGRNRTDFAKYSITQNLWSALAAPPANFGSGHRIAGTSLKIYCLRGDSTVNFWVYNTQTNLWSSLANTPAAVAYGSSLIYPGSGDYLYATLGNGTSDFYRYSITGNAWTQLASAPVLFTAADVNGAPLAYPGRGDYLYLLPTANFAYTWPNAFMYRYSMSLNTWEEMASSPNDFMGTAKLVYPGQGDYLYATRGGSGHYWDILRFRVFAQGEYTSPVKNIGRNQSYGTVTWTDNAKGSVEFRARSGSSPTLSDAVAWSAAPSRVNGSSLALSYPAIKPADEYAQYKLSFIADDMSQIPSLEDLTINYNKYPHVQSIVSNAYNSTQARDRLMKLTWSDAVAPGTDIRFQLRTAPDNNGQPGIWTPWLGPGGTQTFNDNYSTDSDYAHGPTVEVVNGVGKLKKILEAYAYSQRIVLDNSASGQTYTNGVQTIEITSANAHFWSHVKADGSDVRFADALGNVLAYNLSANSASFDFTNKYAKIFIRTPTLPAGQKVSIYLKYGKADAVSVSDANVIGVPSFGNVQAWYRFDEGSGSTLGDSSGKGNTGALVNGPAWVAGKTNSALNFNGSNQYVNLGSGSSLKMTLPMTISYWVKFPASPDGNWRVPVASTSWGGSPGYNLMINANQQFIMTVNGSECTSPRNNWAVPTVSWHMITHTVTSTTSKLYIDSVLKQTFTGSWALSASSYNTWLGYTPVAGYNYFMGDMDEVIFYNKELSASEVSDLYSGVGSLMGVSYYFSTVEDNSTSSALAGWDYRNEIEIDNSMGAELTNYQIRVPMTAGYDAFWARSKSDGSDVRFVDSDNTTILNYSAFSFDYANKTAVYWVKVPKINAGEIKRIYLYYGRSDASAVSTFSNTMVKDFGESGSANTSGLAVDGIAAKAAISSAPALNPTQKVSVEADVKYDTGYWPDGWTYRKKVFLDNTAGSRTAIGVIVQFDVPYQPEMKSDYSDLRFWELDHSIKLRYRLVSSDVSKATFQLEIPVLPKGVKGIYLYYGNALASSESDNIYYFYDDFNGTTWDTTKWGTPTGTGTVTFTTVDGRSVVQHLNTNDWYIETLGSFTGDLTIEVMTKGTVSTDHDQYFRIYQDVNNYWGGNSGDNDAPNIYHTVESLFGGVATRSTGTTYLQNNWQLLTIRRSGNTISNIYNGETRTISPSNLINVGKLRWSSDSDSASFIQYVDYVKIYSGSGGGDVGVSTSFGGQETTGSIQRWLPGFAYRKKISINNTGGAAFTNSTYSVDVDWVSEKMKVDYGDIRFVDTDGKKLSYRINSSNASQANFSIQIPIVPANAVKDVFMYYGNPLAIAESDSGLAATTTAGLITWYKFDEGTGTIASDSSPLVNNASLYNGVVWTTDRWGRAGKALNFDGTTGYVRKTSVSTYNRVNGQELSVGAWIYPTVWSGYRDIVANRNASVYNWILYSHTTGGSVQLHGSAQNKSTYIPPTNQWTHLVATVDSFGFSKLYANGVLVQTVNGYSYNLTTPNELSIGNFGTSEYFSGKIDEVVIYDRALTAAEVQGLATINNVTSAFAAEESAPSGLDQAIVEKPGAYGLKFTDAGLTALLNGNTLSTVNYVSGQMMHAAMTYDGGALKLYVNGDLKASSVVTGAINTNGNALEIGRGLNGIVDEARVWNIARVGGSINEDKYKYLMGNEPGLAGYWRFNENTGASAVDATIYGNAATLSGGAGWTARPFVYTNAKASCIYHMDEGAGLTSSDVSGNNNTLTLSNTLWSGTDLPGFPSGKSLTFDNATSRASAAANASLDLTGQVSIEAWIAPLTNVGRHIILSKGSDTSSRWNYQLVQVADKVQFSFYNGVDKAHPVTTSFIIAGQSYHIVATFDETTDTVRLYVNASLAYTNTLETSNMLTNADPLYIGADASGASVFSGTIDDVRVYNRVLGADEVLAHYENRLPAARMPTIYNVYAPDAVDGGIGAYVSDNPVLQPVLGAFFTNKNLIQFQEISTKPFGTDIRYQVSADGYTWYWWDGTQWSEVSGGYAQTNTASEVNAQLAAFEDLFTNGDFIYRAYLHSDASSFRTPSLENVALTLQTGDTYYVDHLGGTPINGMHTDADNDQWFQYKAYLFSEGQETAFLDDVTIDYIEAYLRLTSLNGGEVLGVGSTVAINWSSQALQVSGGSGLVSLDYSVDGGSTWVNIAVNVANTGTYNWTVPDAPSQDAMVRIRSEDLPVVSDISDASFRILSVAVTSPNGAEIWEAGKQHNITWDISGSVPSNILKIEFSLDNGGNWQTISAVAPNTGVYAWTVPAAYTDNALIRISSATNSRIVDTSDAVFSVVRPPAFSVTSPAAGEQLSVGSTASIIWRTNSLLFSANVTLEYSVDDFIDDAHPIATVAVGTPQGAGNTSVIEGTYAWVLPDVVSTTVKVRVSETAIPAGRDTQQAMAGKSSVFAIIEPIITVSAPVATDVWVVGDVHNVTWSVQGQISNDLKLEYSLDGTTYALIADHVANSGTYAWTLPAEAEGGSVTVRVTDNARAQVTAGSAAFRVLAHATVELIQPLGGETLTMGTDYQIRWRTYGQKLQSGGADYNKVSIAYSTDNGASWIFVGFDLANTGTYTWRVPDTPSAQALLKVYDQNDGQAVDVTDAVFAIVLPRIVLTAANGGETWYATGTYHILWSSEGSVSNNLKIEYSSDSGTSWYQIAAGQANSGDYLWSPIADVASTQMRLRITDMSRPAVSVVSAADFTVTAPTITLISPNGGEVWAVGTTHDIRWYSTGEADGAIRDNLTLQFSVNGGTAWTTVATNQTNDGVFEWVVQDNISTHCRFRIFDATRPATTDASEADFAIALPSVTLVSPNGMEEWPAGSTQQVRWTSLGAVSDNLKIEYSKDNFMTAVQVAAGEFNDGDYTWTVPDDLSAVVKLRLTDVSRPEIYDVTDAVFSIVNPVITVTYPNGGELVSAADTENITWANIGYVGNSIKIEYSKDGFVSDVHLVSAGAPNTATYAWTVPEDISTTVKLRLTDNTRPLVWDKSNGNFTILPMPVITITSPVEGDVWRTGTVKDITWTDNGGRISNNLAFQYSTNGGVSWQDITSGEANDGVYSWTIPVDVSDTAKVRIVDLAHPTTIATSPVFTLAAPKITLTSPNGGEVWAVADNAPITWTTDGAVSDNIVMEYSTDAGASWYSVRGGIANAGSYTWSVADDSTERAMVRLKDGNNLAVVDVSDGVFSIIPLPTLAVTAPNGGEEYVLSDTVNVAWTSRGLDISNLTLDYSNDNFMSRRIIATNLPNSGTYTWLIPQDALSGQTLQIRLTDGHRTLITDRSDGFFRIRGGFRVIAPNGGEKWVAKSPQTLSWQTLGTVATVRLEYTVDGINWAFIGTAQNTGVYTWTTPDILSDKVRVRISDANDDTVKDESDADLRLVYATVTFKVMDYDTYQHLQDFSVSEPASGWSDTGLSSPITRTGLYSYGSYTTFFSKQEYIDNSVSWSPPKQGTDPYVVTAYLENAASAQVTWEAILTYSFSPATDSLVAVGSLQRKGKLVGTSEVERSDMGLATFNIYQPDGATVRNAMTAVAPAQTGMYNFTLPETRFESGKVYPATLSVEYRGREYVSAANIDVGSEILQYQFFTQTSKQLMDSVSNIQATVQSTAVDIKENVRADIQTLKTELTTETAKILATTTQALPAQIDALQESTEKILRSQILNSENSIKTGETLVVRYRTLSGMSPLIDVYNAANVQEITRGAMTEIGTTGIYEYPVLFYSSWGKGDFTVVCSEPTQVTMDALTVTVQSSNVDQVYSQVSSLLGTTSGITNINTMVTNLTAQFAAIESVIAGAGKKIAEAGRGDIQATVAPLYGQLVSVAKQIRGMTGDQGVNLDKLYNVVEERKDDVVYIKNKTQELKAAMQINQKLIENMNNKPVTQVWYEYKE